MDGNNVFQISRNTYKIIDSIENIAVVDSFVKNNKIGKGSGEARLYIGSQKTDDYFNKFFNSFTHKNNCFFLKKDFLSFLDDAKYEYEVQEQGYNKDISKYWSELQKEAISLNEINYFTIEAAIGKKDNARFYIRSYDEIFREYFRKISLPTITYVSIYKVIDPNKKEFFYFYIYLDYAYNPLYHPKRIRVEEKKIQEESNLNKNEKLQLVKSRTGQGKYKDGLLEEMPECLITKVNDERVLIGSHIKPWIISSDDEKTDPHNGLTLTPTYDKLFDQGFISFEDDGKILISPYISPLNIKKLYLTKDKKYNIPNMELRKNYLKYHRENIFKK